MGLFSITISPTPLPLLCHSPRHLKRRRRYSTTTTRCHNNAEITTTTTSSPVMPVDRRGMIIGLGGLYGMADHSAAAAPATVHPVPHSLGNLPNCHFSPSDSVVDYQFPSPADMPLRVRRPAHLVDGKFVAKYNEGLRRMKALPESHPLNFYTLAKNHAIYVHDNWLFLPWHRFYIYFYERALGKLLGDETFALPFWNFDSPEGMAIPSLFLDPASTLYNPKRDPAHMPPAVLDFWYVYGAGTPLGEERQRRAAENVTEMRRVFRQSLGRAELFMGERAAAEGEAELRSAGRLDSVHKAIHQWVGPAALPWMDMGNIHASTKDPVFYSLHSNIDRLWQLYRNFRGNGPDFDDDEWLDAAFNFGDENGRHVRVKVRDCLDPLKMGYTYEEVPVPWAGHKPIPVSAPNPTRIQPVSFEPVIEFGSGTKPLDAPLRILVPRPKANRTNVEKSEAVEVLHIKGIDVVPSGGPARFDVFIAPANGGSAGLGHGEFAGSYVKPLRVHGANDKAVHAAAEGKRKKGSMKLGITSVIEDLEAEDAARLVVTLVPTDGEITVDSIGIKLLPTDRPRLL